MDQPYYTTLIDAVADIPDPARLAANVIFGAARTPKDTFRRMLYWALQHTRLPDGGGV